MASEIDARNLPLKAIVADPRFNTRWMPLDTEGKVDLKSLQEDEGFMGVVSAMKAAGQQDPIHVSGPYDDGTYQLDAGFTRYYARVVLKARDIMAIVHPPRTEADRLRTNIAENVNRSIHWLDQTGGLIRLKVSSKDGAALTGKSVSQIQNYLRTYKALGEIEVIDQARQLGVPEAPAFAIAGIRSKAKRAEAWNTYVETGKVPVKTGESKAGRKVGGSMAALIERCPAFRALRRWFPPKSDDRVEGCARWLDLVCQADSKGFDLGGVAAYYESATSMWVFCPLDTFKPETLPPGVWVYTPSSLYLTAAGEEEERDGEEGEEE